MIETVQATIANKMIELRFPVLPLTDHWLPFLVKNGEQSVFQTIEEDTHLFTMSFYGVAFFREDIQDRIAFSMSDPHTCISYSKDWANIVACGASEEDLFELIITAFYSRLTFCEPAVLLHASAVKHKGEAILFIGPSGIGKTTQAELWQKHLQAEILNGDKVFVRMDQQWPIAYGSPWSGSSPYIVNDGAPIKAIVLLRQGKSNNIEKLANLNTLMSLSKHVFFPQWDRQCTANATQMLGFIVEHIPVYLLTCRPDEEAVLVTKKTIW